MINKKDREMKRREYTQKLMIRLNARRKSNNYVSE